MGVADRRARNDSAISHYIGMFADISARKSAEARVQQLVNFDSLTDLPSRALLQQRLPDMLAGHRYADSILGVLFIDLDRFKNIADTFGHRASDEIPAPGGHPPARLHRPRRFALPPRRRFNSMLVLLM